jgi:hypothetical protein
MCNVRCKHLHARSNVYVRSHTYDTLLLLLFVVVCVSTSSRSYDRSYVNRTYVLDFMRHVLFDLVAFFCSPVNSCTNARNIIASAAAITCRYDVHLYILHNKHLI